MQTERPRHNALKPTTNVQTLLHSDSRISLPDWRSQCIRGKGVFEVRLRAKVGGVNDVRFV